MGALGGFVIPPVMGFAVHNLGHSGYPIGFVVFIFLALFSLSMAWVLKYTQDAPVSANAHGSSPGTEKQNTQP
jgi:nitrate/nitrite transporter NarK